MARVKDNQEFPDQMEITVPIQFFQPLHPLAVVEVEPLALMVLLAVLVAVEVVVVVLRFR